MRSLLTGGAALAASLALAACGGSSSQDMAAPAGSGGKTVSVKSFDGVGKVLVDAGGKALYASNVESDGKVRCTGGCTSFWKPLTVSSGMPTAAPGVGKLGVAKRPDGARQVTAGGKLLYTFSQDSAGKLSGNGFSDDFGGRHFTWNAVLARGMTAGSGGAQGHGSSSGGSPSHQYDSGGY